MQRLLGMRKKFKQPFIKASVLATSAFLVLNFQNCAQQKFGSIAAAPLVTSSSIPSITQVHTRSVQLKANPTKIDFLLVVDNSISMYDDSIALASKMIELFTALANSQLDWQMCLVSTNMLSQGQSYPWVGGASGIVLNKQTQNISKVVTDSVVYIFDETNNNGDERGIAQVYNHLVNANATSCYREGALFVPLFTSDEDERSAGETDYSYVSEDIDFINRPSGPIEDIDRPEFYIVEFKRRYPNKTLQANSIVIKTGDQACFSEQDQHSNVSFGKFFERFSALTNGTVTSLCEPDYSKNLNTIFASVTAASQNLQLDCTPKQAPEVIFQPANSAITYKVIDNFIAVSYPSDRNYSVTVKYTCD